MDNNIKKFFEKSKLTKEELHDFLEKLKESDVKLEHTRAYRTLMNQARRNILRFIGYKIKNMDELKKEFNLGEEQLKYHLLMLNQCLYIIDSPKGWKVTPKGLGFLENAKLGDF